MLRTIDETKSYMQRMGSLYNDHDFVTFSSDPHVIMLTAAAKAAKFGVRANTFNDELIGIGDYDEAPAWQAALSSGITQPYTFPVASTILLTPDAATEAGLPDVGDDPVPLYGYVAVIYDRYAMGVTLDKRKVTTQYAASRDTLNSFYHSLIRYQINDSYPIVAFYISEEE